MTKRQRQRDKDRGVFTVQNVGNNPVESLDFSFLSAVIRYTYLKLLESESPTLQYIHEGHSMKSWAVLIQLCGDFKVCSASTVCS